MTCSELQAAWAEARTQPDFYAAFEALTGLDKTTVGGHFAAWNQMPHSEAVAIAERQGTTVHDGGFQAYLAEVTASGA